MKKAVYDVSGNWMVFESDHKTFNRQTNVISYGNIVANTMVGMHIRSFDETECGNLTRPPGHLQDFDIDYFRRVFKQQFTWMIEPKVVEALKHRSGWLYCLHHYNYQRTIGPKRVIHGWILTDYGHNLINYWVTGPTYKSWSVVHEAKKYLCNEGGE